VEGLLLSSLPPATAHELCSELDANHADASTMNEAAQAVDAAQRERHGREAKRKNQAAKEPEILAELQAKLERNGAKPPDMWSKLYDMKTRLEQAIPVTQRMIAGALATIRSVAGHTFSSEPSHFYLPFVLWCLRGSSVGPSPMTVLEWRSDMATWSAQRLKRMRRLMLQELAPFLPSLVAQDADAKCLYAAPEAGCELSQWRAVLCGYVSRKLCACWSRNSGAPHARCSLTMHPSVCAS